jgi:hypothetical protein
MPTYVAGYWGSVTPKFRTITTPPIRLKLVTRTISTKVASKGRPASGQIFPRGRS